MNLERNRFKFFAATFVVVVLLTTCVKNDDYTIPDVSTQALHIDPTQITTFQAVRARYEQALTLGETIAVFDNDQDLYILGYVISSDKASNFYEELIIQNKIDDSNPPEDPRLGFRVDVNVSRLYETYEVGRKVYLKLNGLAVGESNGVMVIGKAISNRLEQIQAFEYQNIIMRDSTVEILSPKMTSIVNLTPNDLNTLIQLDDVQIHRHDLMLTYAGEPTDEFDGLRTLEQCSANHTILLQTSVFSDFKSLQVPQSRGSVNGVYSRDFGGDFDVFIINSSADFNINDENRCDPTALDCGTLSDLGAVTVFAEDFENQSLNTPISGNGWTNYIETGSQSWEAYSSTGSNPSLGISARIDSYQSGNSSSVSWLITPAINLELHNSVSLNFKTSNSFSDGSNLELMYSTNWEGTVSTINTATWGILSAADIVRDTDDFASWINSGIVDLSCAEGTIYIAFKYTGSGDANYDGAYELDDIFINAE